MGVMAGKEPDYGPTAKTVARNVARLRESQNLTYTQVSERLTTAGWPLTPVAVRRVEQCQRRVTVDDLVAFSVALDTSPTTLLMPDTENPDNTVLLTGMAPDVDAPTAVRAWAWLGGSIPQSAEKPYLPFITRSWPLWRLTEYSDQLSKALAENQKLSAGKETTGLVTFSAGAPKTAQKPDGNDK
ncbi:putative DNA binding protein [Mycobacteroides abscessus subsp. massiliense]|nr:putative DNA binding protein [Mycobacteroides abscessus subsp. massiliense]SKU94661.1 putative DNA binding protein [Mycobacteroides abscessus subsp. massiliense]